MRKKKTVGVLCLCLLLALSLAGCGGKGEEPLTTPEAYVLGENSAPPFDQQLAEGEGSLVSLDRQYPAAPEESPAPTEMALAESSAPPEESAPAESEAPKEEKKDEAEPEGDPDRLIYTYAELPVAGTLVEAYAKALLALEDPFQPVDKENLPADAPDYTGETGTLRLARNAVEEQMLFRIRLDWTPTSCAVTVDRAEGHLEKPTPPAQIQPMTLNQAVEFIEGMDPATLGLPGESMAMYNVYPIEGLVSVNGQACAQFRVYHNTEAGTNEVAGIYLITADKKHIYSLSPDTGEVIDQLTK